MAELLGVELARPGTWQLSSGKREFTAQMLRDAADFHAAAGGQRIPLGFGHLDNRFDGEPAFGWLSNVRYAEDDTGPVLLGDLTDLDDWVAAAAPARWPHRSVEGVMGVKFGDREYGLVLTRLALLGSTPPGIPALKSLSDLRQLVSAAAAVSGAEWIAAEPAGEIVMAHVRHNQKSHGNRSGKADLVPSKTGLGSKAASRGDGQSKGREFSNRELRDILGSNNARSVNEHRALLEKAGATKEQSEKILRDLGADIDADSGHLTFDPGSLLNRRAASEEQAEKLAQVRSRLKEFTPKAYEQLLGSGPAAITHGPTRAVFESMRENGWVLTAVGAGTSSSTWTSPDGSRSITMNPGDPPSLYDSANRKLSGKRAREIVSGSAVKAAASSYPQKGAGMNPALIREALQLPSDASDDEVKASLASSGLVASQPEPRPAPEPAPQPEPEPEPDRAPQLVAASGVVTISASVWQETQNTIKRLASHVDQAKKDEAEKVIASAVEQGKFTPAQKPHFTKLWHADPEGTKALIEGLTPNSALAIAASGYADLDDKEFDREFAGLFPSGFMSKGA